MFQLDQQFLIDVGLAELPEEQRKPFLQYVYDQLEQRVGMRLSDGMSDAQLEEFESIVERKQEVIQPWLAQHAPDYVNDPAFTRIQQVTGLGATDPGLRAEYTATKWLEVNRPDYRDVVASVLDELKKEISASKNAILGQTPPPAAAA